MLLHIVHRDGRYDFVSTSGLEYLIAAREITRFERSDGWVNIKSSDIRKAGRSKNYMGPERRSL